MLGYKIMVTVGNSESCLYCHGYKGYIWVMSMLSWLQGIHLGHVYVVMVTAGNSE